MKADPKAKWSWIDAAATSTTDDCIDWPWGRHSGGYGVVRQDGFSRLVHAIVCEIAHGPRPTARDAAHSCGRPICCNPRHLRWATRSENQADRVGHGTDNRGSRSSSAKLNWYAVHWIRSLYATGDHTLRGLGELFGVGHTEIRRIVTHERWVTS